MKLYFFIVIFVFSMLFLKAQERELIIETDSIKIFDTYLSLNTSENVFPNFYKDGLIYASRYKSSFYDLFYSDLRSESIKLRIGSKYNYGGAAIYNDDIYYSGIDRNMSANNNFNHLIYKGKLDNLKVTRSRVLAFCKRGFDYDHPTISKDGKHMVVVTNERGKVHLLELIKNERNEWRRSKVIFISQSKASFLNTTYYNENTLYFSSNMIDKEDRFKLKIVKGEWKMVKTALKNSVFNIYKIQKVNDLWGLPEKVGVFNSEFDDLGVVFLNEKSGYLTTFRFNNSDNIFYFELK